MKFIKVKNYDEMSKKAYELFAESMNQIEEPNIGLATGSTPEGLYKLMVENHKQNKLDFSKTRTFNLDEYCGLDENDPTSYHYFMNDKLFNHIEIPSNNIFIPSGTAPDMEKECENYEAELKENGRINVQLLGIGKNGHIGFNEPGTAFDSRTHIVELDDTTIKANARFFDSVNDVPTKAITMGIGTILDSEQIIMIISGEGKREAVKQLFTGEIREDFPASALHHHPNAVVIIDEAAWAE